MFSIQKDCPSNELTQKEFTKIFQSMYPSGNVKDFCKRVFTIYDLDKNGRIDFNEMMIALSILRENDVTKKIELVFRMFDINDDGFLTLTEVKNIINYIDKLARVDDYHKGQNDPITKASNLIRMFDANNDKLVSLEEFIKGCLENPEILASFNNQQYSLKF